MKILLKLFLLFLITLITNVLYAQNDQFNWVNSYGGTYADLVYDIKTDHEMNSYVLGSTGSPEIKFDSITLINPPSKFADKMYLGSGGRPDENQHWRVQKNLGQGFVMKLDPDGNVIWVVKLFEDHNSRGIDPYHMDMDKNGNLVIVGLLTEYISEDHYYDKMFMIKINKEGGLLWQQLLKAGQCKAVDVKVDHNNNICVLGKYRFAKKIKINKSVEIPVKHDASWSTFVAKYDNNGKAIWVKAIQGDQFDIPKRLTVDQKNNIYFTVNFNSQKLKIDQYELLNDSDFDVAVIKLEAEKGNVKWVKHFGAAGYSSSTDIKIVKDEVFVTGVFKHGGFNNTGDVNYYKVNHSYILCYKSRNGKLKWIKNIEGPESDYFNVLNVKNNNLYILGSFTSNEFEQDLIKYQINGTGPSVLFKYNLNGDIIAYNDFRINNNEMSTAFSFEDDQNIMVTGYYEYPLLSVNDSSKTYFDTDIFIACLNEEVLFKSSPLNDLTGGSNSSLLLYNDTSLIQSNLRNDNVGDPVSVKIYPNPSYGSFTLELGTYDENESLKIELINSDGKIVISKFLDPYPKIKITDLATGAYVIRISFGNNAISKKIIVM